MNKQRMFILIAAVVGIAATFLPWIELPMGSVAGTKGDGWITLLLFTISAVITALGQRTSSLQGVKLYGAIAPALISGLIALYKILNFNSSMPDSDNPFALAIRSSISVGIGLYLVLIAGLVIPAIGYFLKDSE